MSDNNNSPDHYYTKKPKSKLKKYQIGYSFFNKYYKFITATGVFSYRKVDKGTIILIKSLILPKNKNSNILDLGCGYGVIGIVLADQLSDSQIIMTDINTRAISLCKKNIAINKINNASIKSGSLFQPLEEKFDLIVTNPPLALGKKVLYKIFEKSSEYLTPNGSFQFVIRTKQGAKSAFNKLKDIFGDKNVQLLKIKSGYRVFLARNI